MAGTVTTDLALIDNCDATTGWTAWGGSGLGVESEQQKEGAGCLGVKANNAAGVIWKTISTLPQNMLFYIWVMSTAPAKLQTKANGGIAIRLGTDGSNYRTWYVGGRYNYRGGWENFCVNPTQAGSIADVGTYDPATITYMAIVFVTTSTSTKNVNFWDIIRNGTGLTIYGGTAASPATFQDLLDYEETNASGILYKYGGAIFVQGKLYFGSTTAVSDTYFKDTSQIVSFVDRIVGSAFYEIIFQGKAGQTTEVYFGDPTTEVSGLFIKSEGAAKYKLTATDANLTKMGLYGCSFVSADVITLPTNNPNKKVKACNFEACARLVASTCAVTESKFISAPGDAVLITNDPHYVTSCDFINCLRGVELNTVGDGTYDFNALIFTGTTYHVNNTSGSTLTINCLNGANASTYTGSAVTFVNTVILTVQGVKTASEPTNYVRCRIEKVSDGSQIMNQEATTSYGAEGYYKAVKSDYNYPGSDVDVKVKARYKTYLPFEGNATITSAGLTVTAVWLPDPNYA